MPEHGQVSPGVATDLASKICLVTGADKNYFLLVATLVESLRIHVPGIAVRVMDLGFTPAQARFLDELGLRLPLPPHFPPRQHPYLLKASMHDYVAHLQDFDHYVWIDSDMICVADGTSRLLDLVAGMIDSGQNLAVAPDLGPNPTALAFTENVPAATFRRYIDEGVIDGGAVYMNAGFMVFLHARPLLKRWQELANALFEDKCYDQNAINLMFHGDHRAARMLDPRVWNLHSNLLSEVTDGAEGLVCRGEKALFIHCTSYLSSLHEEKGLGITVKEGVIESNFKFFRNPALKQRQIAYFNSFLKRNIGLMRGCGLPRPAAQAQRQSE